MTPALRQRLEPHLSLPRHRHGDGYAAIVLAGAYEEAGDAGRRALRPGDVALHPAWSAHSNAVSAGGAVVLNLPWPRAGAAGFARTEDLDAIVRLADREADAAADLLARRLAATAPELAEWPDLLARDLRNDPRLRLRCWARRRGLAAETLSRGFARVYGVSPKRYRADVRALSAVRALAGSPTPLAELALEAGFCDQAQMTRAVKGVTGRPPAAWRRSTGDKTLD